MKHIFIAVIMSGVFVKLATAQTSSAFAQLENADHLSSVGQIGVPFDNSRAENSAVDAVQAPCVGQERCRGQKGGPERKAGTVVLSNCVYGKSRRDRYAITVYKITDRTKFVKYESKKGAVTGAGWGMVLWTVGTVSSPAGLLGALALGAVLGAAAGFALYRRNARKRPEEFSVRSYGRPKGPSLL